MTFKMNMLVSAKISAASVKEMIRDAVEAETGRHVKDITFDTKVVTHGYGPNEYDERVFDGVTVELGDELGL